MCDTQSVERRCETSCPPSSSERAADANGGYLRNQMRLYEIYDGENWCLEETNAKDMGLVKIVSSRLGDMYYCSARCSGDYLKTLWKTSVIILGVRLV